VHAAARRSWLEVGLGLRQEFIDEIPPVNLARGLADQGQVHPGRAVGVGEVAACDEGREPGDARQAAQSLFQQRRDFLFGFLGHRAAEKGFCVKAARRQFEVQFDVLDQFAAARAGERVARIQRRLGPVVLDEFGEHLRLAEHALRRAHEGHLAHRRFAEHFLALRGINTRLR
jgi:hypothetical protein